MIRWASYSLIRLTWISSRQKCFLEDDLTKNFRAEDNLASLPWKVDLNCQVALDFFVGCLEKVKRCCTMVPKEKHHKNNSNQIARQRILSSNHHVFFLRIMGTQVTLSLENPIPNPGSSSLEASQEHAALGPPEKSKSSSNCWYCFQNSACQDLQENPHQVWGLSRTLMHRLDCLCFLMELIMFFWGFHAMRVKIFCDLSAPPMKRNLLPLVVPCRGFSSMLSSPSHSTNWSFLFFLLDANLLYPTGSMYGISTYVSNWIITYLLNGIYRIFWGYILTSWNIQAMILKVNMFSSFSAHVQIICCVEKVVITGRTALVHDKME